MTDDTLILVVEDDQDLAELMQEELTDAGYRVLCEHSTEAALPVLLRERPELIVSDLRLPGADGRELLRHARQGDWQPAFLMITAYGTIDQAVEALKAGADEFLTKPLSMEHLLLTTEKLLKHRSLQREADQYRQLLSGNPVHGLHGNSAAMKRLLYDIQQIGPADGPVLILGESGTGKELVARALHAESPRANQPFIAVNCAGIPGELMESEFFGHVAGAFTGARGQRDGLFLQAQGGTLLLDEVAEMPTALQAKLLRVLQEGKVRRVGSETEMDVDVRILAATHQNLSDAIEAGRFREDLYYRLETFSIPIPALRERRDDILPLARHFLNQLKQSRQPPVSGFTRAAEKALSRYDFPGNVRELQNVIERAAVFCQGTRIDQSELPERFHPQPGCDDSTRRDGLDDWMAQQALEALPAASTLQRRYTHHVLERTGGNKQKTAAILGVTRRTLYRWLAEDSNAHHDG